MINFQLAGKLDLGNKVVIKQNYFSVSYAVWISFAIRHYCVSNPCFGRIIFNFYFVCYLIQIEKGIFFTRI